MSLNTELELQALLSRMLAVEASVEDVAAAVGLAPSESSSAITVRDTVPFQVTVEPASGTGPADRIRVLLGSVYLGAATLSQDDTLVLGDVASAVDPASAAYWLTTADATAATDVWVEANHLTLHWRLRIRARTAAIPEWRASGNVAWGAKGISIFPLFSTGWTSTLASFDPFTFYQHRLGDIIIPAEQYDGFDLEAVGSPSSFLNGGVLHIRGMLQVNSFLAVALESENDVSGSREFKNAMLAIDEDVTLTAGTTEYIYVGCDDIHASPPVKVVTVTSSPSSTVLHRRTGNPPNAWHEHHRVWKIVIDAAGYIESWEKYCANVVLHDARFPDSKADAVGGPAPDLKSIEFSTGSTGEDDRGLFSLYEFSAGPQFTGIDTSTDWLLLRENQGANKAELRYISVATLAGSLVGAGVGAGAPTGGLPYDLNINSSIYHYRLEFQPHDGPTAAKTANNDHDGRFLYARSAVTAPNTHDLYTTGEVWADDFRLQDFPTTNFWNHVGFEARVSGGIAIETTTGGVDIVSNTNSITIDSTADLLLVLHAGLKINSLPGQSFTKTWTDHASVVHSLTFTHGICTAKT